MARVQAVNHVGWAVQYYKANEGWKTIHTTDTKSNADSLCLMYSTYFSGAEYRVYEEVSCA